MPAISPKSESRKRPWFQLHLSTAVVLMFVAGALIWANTRQRSIRDFDLVDFADAILNCDAPLEMFANPAKAPNNSYIEPEYGWPTTAVFSKVTAHLWTGLYFDKKDYKVRYARAALNLAVALAALFATACVCEKWIRWRN